MAPPGIPAGFPAPSRPPPLPRLFSRLSYLSKRSIQSHSPSFEANDERSTSTHDADESMPPTRNSDCFDELRYPGEDTRSTSRMELVGWYAYAFAAEVYVICGIGSFVPILLESLARENGVLLSDRTTPCPSSSEKVDRKGGACVVEVLGMEINTASFAMYTFSVSVLLQALVVVSISCAADHGSYRKNMLLAFAWVGSFSVMAYIFVSAEFLVTGAFLAIVSNTSFGASYVLLNSFLPLLVRHHPAVEAAAASAPSPDSTIAPHEDSQWLEHSTRSEDEAIEINAGPTSSLVGIEASDGEVRACRALTAKEMASLELHLSTQISAKGVGIGYMAALFLQCASILMLVLIGHFEDTTWSLRVVLLVIGAWWSVFTIPSALWLRPRPGPPLPVASHRKGLMAWLSYAAYAWSSLFRTMILARRLVDVALFLAAWFLLSDAIATTSSTAILFAKTTLHMETWALGMINVIVTAFGVIGAFGWSWFSRTFGLDPHHTILACIALFELIPLYGLLGYIPFVRAWGVLGLQQPWEMYPLAAVYGLLLGGLGGYCRSLYGQLIPPGSEAAFYALYAITDKGSSVFGPAIVASIINASGGEIRPAFWFLGLLVGIPFPLFWFVQVARGRSEGEKLAVLIERYKTDGASPPQNAYSPPLGASHGDDGEQGHCSSVFTIVDERTAWRESDMESRQGILAAYDMNQDDG